MDEHLSPPNLSLLGCRQRQDRLRSVLQEQQLPAALICDRRHVFYFTGFWCRPMFAPFVLIQSDGPTILSAPFLPECEVAADQVCEYESNRMATFVDDQWEAATKPLLPYLPTAHRIGSDWPLPVDTNPRCSFYNLRPSIWQLRRTKYVDEIAIIRLAIAATEAAYQYARNALQPGVTEVDIFSQMQAAALKVVGEPIGEFGNDFQFCSPGGMPRRRAAQEGEIAILDVSVTVRCYHSDLSRCFVIGRQPSIAQQCAWERIKEVLDLVEKTVRVGLSCKELFRSANDMLDGYRGWKFFHHLGHGIGLSPHEAPRLNPNWDDTFQIGDVFTVEPGLYGDELRAGLRIEENFLLTPSGVEKLSSFPISLV